MNRRTAWLCGLTLLAMVVLGVLIPSMRENSFTVSATALTSVALAAVIVGTVLGVGARNRSSE